MSTGDQIEAYLRSTDWIRREIRKATELPAKEMLPRIRELLERSESLSREVSEFLKEKDTQ